MTRPLVLAAIALGVFVPGAAAGAPQVTTMIVGPHATLWSPHTVTAARTSATAGRRTCRVPERTALAVLAGARRRGGPRFRVTDDGACGALFVDRIGPAANRGRDGWSYKVGTRTPQVGASERSGIRGGSRVVWFWCRLSVRGCQRSLVISAPHSLAPGGSVTVTVRGYDDFAHGVRVRDALVHLGSLNARTDAQGRATFVAPPAGSYAVRAERRGLVPAFPERVRIG